MGETGRELRVRLAEHKSAIKAKKQNAPLVSHFIECEHKETDFVWFVLEKVNINRRGGNMEEK